MARDRPRVREATRTGKPVIMLFHASWCPSVQAVPPGLEDAGVVEASRSFVVILVDVDKDPAPTAAFSPDGTCVPRTLFLRFPTATSNPTSPARTCTIHIVIDIFRYRMSFAR